MAVKGIEIRSIGVYYPEGSDVPSFTNTRVVVRGKIKEGKCKAEHSVEYTLDFDGVPVQEILEKGCAALRIDVAKLREKGDEAVRAINGTTIRVSDIPALTAGDGVDPLLKALKAMGMTEEKALAICADPEKKAKAQAMLLAMEF